MGMKILPGLLIFAALAALAASATEIADRRESQSVSKMYWSDGDSGRLDGKPFRLANIDAPETGGVGAIGGAKCEGEREIGYEAKAFIVELTRGADVEISQSYGTDRYGREVVDLRVNGKSLAQAGLEAGHFRPWPHRGQRALVRKPDWCGMMLASN